jgi:hypothetical protein
MSGGERSLEDIGFSPGRFEIPIKILRISAGQKNCD